MSERLRNYAQMMEANLRAMNISDGTSLGFMIPDTFEAGTLQLVGPGGWIRQRARVIPAEAYDRCLILVGDEDEDDEEDDDPPPPPADTLRVQIVWEMRDAAPLPIDQYKLFHSPGIAKWIDDNGHRLERRDQHATDDDGEPLFDPLPESLPVVRILDDESGKLLWEGLPKTEVDFLKVLREHCANCRQPQTKPHPKPPVRRGILRRR